MSKTKRKSYELRHDNKPWTATDLLKLRGYAKLKMSARQAAEKLGRSTGAVKFKAMTEGVRFHKINQPRGAQRTPKQRALLSRLATRRHRARRAA